MERQKYHKWTENEIQILMDSVEKNGHKWQAIQQEHFPLLQPMLLKNKYYAVLKRNSSDSKRSSHPDIDEVPRPKVIRRTSRMVEEETLSTLPNLSKELDDPDVRPLTLEEFADMLDDDML